MKKGERIEEVMIKGNKNAKRIDHRRVDRRIVSKEKR
jgi:hypothetical protein